MAHSAPKTKKQPIKAQKTIRQKPGRKSSHVYPICVLPGCTTQVRTYGATCCSRSHATLYRYMTKGEATANAITPPPKRVQQQKLLPVGIVLDN